MEEFADQCWNGKVVFDHTYFTSIPSQICELKKDLVFVTSFSNVTGNKFIRYPAQDVSGIKTDGGLVLVDTGTIASGLSIFEKVILIC
jgi:hypothetical protein